VANYFNSLSLRAQLAQLGQCEFMNASEFEDGVDYLRGKKIVVVGCGSQGLNQGLNLRDSGLDVAYTLRQSAIDEKRQSFLNAEGNGFRVGNYQEMIPTADLVLNLTPDKQHSSVVADIEPLMKANACLAYSHGFNIVEEGQKIRPDLTVVMVAPKCPGTEVREEYKRGFGVPTLIAVHADNDPHGEGLAIAKAYAAGTGGHRAGVLMSSFVAEVKSDLMGEQTILCGMLQTGSLLCFDKMVDKGIEPGYASKLVQYGWETITEALKHGGITNMMDRLSNPAKLRAFDLSEEMKQIMRPLYEKHMDDIMTGNFSGGMMADWQTMTAAGIKAESAYYESLHEVPLIANTIARKKLFEMNSTISDTAEYGCYLYNHACLPLLAEFMTDLETDVIGRGLGLNDVGVDNQVLIAVNFEIRSHPVEAIGQTLRGYMTAMKAIV